MYYKQRNLLHVLPSIVISLRMTTTGGKTGRRLCCLLYSKFMYLYIHLLVIFLIMNHLCLVMNHLKLSGPESDGKDANNRNTVVAHTYH